MAFLIKTSPSWDSTPACLVRMPPLYRLCHHHCPSKVLRESKLPSLIKSSNSNITKTYHRTLLLKTQNLDFRQCHQAVAEKDPRCNQLNSRDKNFEPPENHSVGSPLAPSSFKWNTFVPSLCFFKPSRL